MIKLVFFSIGTPRLAPRKEQRKRAELETGRCFDRSIDDDDNDNDEDGGGLQLSPKKRQFARKCKTFASKMLQRNKKQRRNRCQHVSLA